MWWSRVCSSGKMMFGTNWESVQPAWNRVIMLPRCAGWTLIGGTSWAPFITPTSTNAGRICKQARRFVSQPDWQHGWREVFSTQPPWKAKESGDKQVVLSEVWKRKINLLLQTVYYSMTKQLLLYQVSVETERSLWESSYVWFLRSFESYSQDFICSKVTDRQTSAGSSLLVSKGCVFSRQSLCTE